MNFLNSYGGRLWKLGKLYGSVRMRKKVMRADRDDFSQLIAKGRDP